MNRTGRNRRATLNLRAAALTMGMRRRLKWSHKVNESPSSFTWGFCAIAWTAPRDAAVFFVWSPLPWFPRGPGPCCEMHGLPGGGIEALLWKVTTWSDAGLTHPLARAHVTSWSKKRKGNKKHLQRVVCCHVKDNRMRTLRKIALNINTFSRLHYHYYHRRYCRNTH